MFLQPPRFFYGTIEHVFGIRPISTRFVGQVGFDQKGDKQVASIVAAVSLSAFGMHGLAVFLVQRVEQFLLGVDAKL